MASVQPIAAEDLHGIQLDPNQILSDELVGYVGYVRNLCSSLGTKDDTSEGWQDYLNFKKEIEEAQISTFEPDAVDEVHTFENIDLSGDNVEIANMAGDYFVSCQAQLVYAYSANGGLGISPFDKAYIEARKNKSQYLPFGDVQYSPWSWNGGVPFVKNEEAVLTN